MPKQITIAGAGLVGSLLSIILAKRGHKVQVFERRPDMRLANIYQGKSINLALSDRGWRALELAGVADAIRKEAIPMRRRVMHAVDGTLSYQPYGKEDQAIYSVSRGGLNATLMTLAEKHGNVSFHFEHKCENVDLENASATFSLPDGSEKEVTADLLFGTDGAFSAVRSVMQRTDRFTYSQQYIDHGYKELTIPPGPGKSFRLEKEALHIWPRGEYMLIALPNPDGSFTCTLFLGYEGKNSFGNITTDQQALEFFRTTFPDALELMPTFVDDWNRNPTSSLCIIRCYPWNRNGKVTILGDASHAIVPFYGQGMNSGFEDCTALDALMDQYGENWEDLLEAFQRERKPNTDAIAELAMRNFVEMRDLTGDPEFLLRKKIEARFAAKYPDKWLPLYSMVTFSHIPYADALAEGRRQDRIMERVMALSGIETKWDSAEVEELMLSLL